LYILSPILCFGSSILLRVLSSVQHEFAVRPSSIILVYLLATGLIDIVVTWRLLLNSGDITGFAGYNLIAIMATKLVLFLLENQSKEPFLMHQYQGLSPESYSGLLNRSFLGWLNSLILNTSKRRLSTSDLFGLDDNLKSDNLRLRMGKCWKERSTEINLPYKVRSLIMFCRSTGREVDIHRRYDTLPVSSAFATLLPQTHAHCVHICTTVSNNRRLATSIPAKRRKLTNRASRVNICSLFHIHRDCCTLNIIDLAFVWILTPPDPVFAQ
jgi:hypothetical protein